MDLGVGAGIPLDDIRAAVGVARIGGRLLADAHHFHDVLRISTAGSNRGPETLTDLGNLLLTFVILWSYLLWFEFMLTWIANMQVDVVWYGVRTRGFWAWLLAALALLQFVVPFVLLLQRLVKRHPARLRGVAILCLVTQLLFVHWQILPSFRPDDFGSWWMSLVAPLGWAVCGLPITCSECGNLPLLPAADLHATEAMTPGSRMIAKRLGRRR